MNDTLHAHVGQALDRFSVDLVVDGSPAGVGEAVGRLAAFFAEHGAVDLAERLPALAAGEALDQLPARAAQAWDDWATEAEAAHDVAALAGDPELATMFVAEALDHLGTIEATLLKLEDAPADRTLLNDVFRPFHTIKGNAGALGVLTVQQLAHKVENLLDRCRSGEHLVGSAEVDLVLKSVDLTTAMLNDLQGRVAGQPGRSYRAQRLALIDLVDRLVEAGNQPQEISTPAGGDIPLLDLAPSPASAAPGAPAGPAPTAEPAFEMRRSTDDPRESQASVKVDTRKLDGLVDLVGELVLLQSLVYDDPAIAGRNDERLTRNLAQLRRATSELQRAAMSMRMVPIRQTFQKMSRLVRDLSRKSGKPVELVLAGEDTELDRRVVEDINDPLMHMVRNSVDHGIEPVEARLAAGKRDTGRLSLRAFHQGGSIVIEIADDGGGLDAERILRKAVEKGLVPAGADLSPDEIHQLIFAPGFSTADKVTEISGRGVGMDVVRRNIEALRGRIEIHSERGRGTTFTIKLPLTLAILDGLLVDACGRHYVVPTFAIRESLRPRPEQVHRVQGEPRLIQVRESLLPLVWLRDFFNLPGEAVDPTAGTVIVLEEDGRRIGLVVDTLVGKQEVVVKNLGSAFEGVRGVAGGAILGDGRIGLILDAHGLVSVTRREMVA